MGARSAWPAASARRSVRRTASGSCPGGRPGEPLPRRVRDRRVPLHLLRHVPGGLPRRGDPRRAGLRERRVHEGALHLRPRPSDGAGPPRHRAVGPGGSAVGMTTLLFYLFAALALGGGLGMILGRTPIASLLSLVASFFSLAAIYVLLQAHFVAAIQVIVYASAIMVLFLFVIMLLNLGHDYRRDLREFGWIVAGSVVAGLTGYGLLRALAAEDVVTDMGGSLVIEAALRELNAVGAIAAPLFQTYLVPFELTSLLLLVAIVGAVLLAKRRV